MSPVILIPLKLSQTVCLISNKNSIYTQIYTKASLLTEIKLLYNIPLSKTKTVLQNVKF